jgi:hypothetical protein
MANTYKDEQKISLPHRKQRNKLMELQLRSSIWIVNRKQKVNIFE